LVKTILQGGPFQRGRDNTGWRFDVFHFEGYGFRENALPGSSELSIYAKGKIGTGRSIRINEAQCRIYAIVVVNAKGKRDRNKIVIQYIVGLLIAAVVFLLQFATYDGHDIACFDEASGPFGQRCALKVRCDGAGGQAERRK
jgi:hypothetical protein